MLILMLMLMLLLAKVGVEGMVELSPEEVVVLGEGDQAELECKVMASSMFCCCWSARHPRCCNIVPHRTFYFIDSHSSENDDNEPKKVSFTTVLFSSSTQVGPAYPRPSLSWSGDREIFGLLDTSGQVYSHYYCKYPVLFVNS